jgi:hypothetical protein
VHDPGNSVACVTVVPEGVGLAEVWNEFAERECRGYSPLCERICHSVARDDELLGLTAVGPPSARQPNVLLAAVHYLLLGGLDHPLGDVYVGRSAADPGPLFRDVCLTHRDEVLELLANRRTQTNECGRSAVIVPGLAWVAARVGEPLALLDVGASAGLNLLCDRYLIDYGQAGVTGPPDSPVAIECRVVRGQLPLRSRAPALADRVGLDRSPVDLDDPDAARWLLACVWPDTGRLERTAAAIALARDAHPQVVIGDAVEDVVSVLERFPAHATPCVTTTWMLAYLTRGQRDAFIEQLTRFGMHRPLAWISAEGPGVVECIDTGAPPAHDPTTPSVLGAVRFDGGGVQSTMLGWVHPHGRWIDWRA